MREAAAAQASFEMESALAVEEAQRQAYQDLMQLAMQQEAERMAIDQAIANVFLETERQPVDLSALLQPVPGGGMLAGYPYEGFYVTPSAWPESSIPGFVPPTPTVPTPTPPYEAATGSSWDAALQRAIDQGTLRGRRA
jgi:hypothetical protein